MDLSYLFCGITAWESQDDFIHLVVSNAHCGWFQISNMLLYEALCSTEIFLRMHLASTSNREKRKVDLDLLWNVMHFFTKENACEVDINPDGEAKSFIIVLNFFKLI